MCYLLSLVMEGSESSRDTSWEKAWGACPPAGLESRGRSSRNTQPATATCMSDTRGRPPTPKDGLHSRSTPTTWPGCRQRSWLEWRGERCGPGEAASVGRAGPALGVPVWPEPPEAVVSSAGHQPSREAGQTPAGACPHAWPGPPRRPGSRCPPWRWAAGSSHPACALKVPWPSWGGAELQSLCCPPGHPQLTAGLESPQGWHVPTAFRACFPRLCPRTLGPLRGACGPAEALDAGPCQNPRRARTCPCVCTPLTCPAPLLALPASNPQPLVTFRRGVPKGMSSFWSPSPTAWQMLTSPGA